MRMLLIFLAGGIFFSTEAVIYIYIYILYYIILGTIDGKGSFNHGFYTFDISLHNNLGSICDNQQIYAFQLHKRGT